MYNINTKKNKANASKLMQSNNKYKDKCKKNNDELLILKIHVVAYI